MAEVAARTAGVERKTRSHRKRAITRELGFLGVFVFALTSIGLAYGGLVPFSTIAGLLPGVNLAVVISIAAAAALLHAFTFAAIGAAAGRNGADYYLASRVISPSLAFASSFTLVILFALAGGTLIAMIPQAILPMFVGTYALITGDALLPDLIRLMASPSGVVLWGTVGVLVVFGLLLLPPRATQRVLLVGLLLMILAWAVVDTQLSADPGGFPAAWNQYMGQGSFLDHLYKARDLGIQFDFSLGRNLLAGLTLGFFLFYGYFNGTFLAGEVREPGRNLLRGSWLALVVGWVVMVVAALLTQLQIPLDWLASESFLSRSAEFTGQTMPWIVFYGAILNPSPFWVGALALIWVFGMLTLAQVFLYSGSRIILAWAEDGVFPEQVAVVHPTLKSPLVAVLLIACVAVIGVVSEAFSGSMSSTIPILLMAVTQILPVLAIVLLPFKRKDWVSSVPAPFSRKLGPLPLVSLVGGLSLVYLVWMIVAGFLYPVFGALDIVPLVVMVGSVTFALVWFHARKSYRKSRGETYDFSWQAPPDLDEQN